MCLMALVACVSLNSCGYERVDAGHEGGGGGNGGESYQLAWCFARDCTSIGQLYKELQYSLNLVITHMDVCQITSSNWSFNYYDRVGKPHLNVGTSSRNPLKEISKHFTANLCYVPDHIYYNDSVESNVKLLK